MKPIINLALDVKVHLVHVFKTERGCPSKCLIRPSTKAVYIIGAWVEVDAFNVGKRG